MDTNPKPTSAGESLPTATESAGKLSETPSTPSAGPPATGAKCSRSYMVFVAIKDDNGSTTYRLDRMNPGKVAIRAWSMTKLTEAGGDSDVRHIHQDRYGWHCTCEAGVYHKPKTNVDCRHVAALVDAGIIEVRT